MPTKPLLWILLWTVAFPGTAQVVVRSPTSSSVARSKSSTERVPTLDLAKTNGVATTSDDARAAHYSIKGEKPLCDPATGKFHVLTTSATTFTRDPLPASSSDVIVLGTITSVEPRLSGDGTMIYSKFSFVPTKYFKGPPGLPPTHLTLDRIGGIAIFPNGMHKFVGATGIGLPTSGHQYLLFLMATSELGVYEIKTGYGVDGAHVMSLDRAGDDLDGETPAALITKIQSRNK